MFNLYEYSYRLYRFKKLAEALVPRRITKYDLRATGLGDIKGVKPGMKDIARLEDIVTKSGGSLEKMMQLVRNMAKAITDKDKAQRRAAAALEVLPDKIADEAAQEFMSKW